MILPGIDTVFHFLNLDTLNQTENQLNPGGGVKQISFTNRNNHFKLFERTILGKFMTKDAEYSQKSTRKKFSGNLNVRNAFIHNAETATPTRVTDA